MCRAGHINGANRWLWHTLRYLTMSKVVLESRPVLISSRNSTRLGPTIISPAHSQEERL